MAARVHGRLESGGILSTERYTQSTFGSDKNDSLVASFRFYLSVAEIGPSRLVFQADVRDKYDFFDKLNREQLQLDASNTLQLRELQVRQPVFSESGWGYSLGRFPVLEAGAAYADGALINRKFNRAWNAATFAGLNPKISGQTYLGFNSDAHVAGAYVTYQRPNTDWDSNFYLSQAIVTQSVGGVTDRTYLFQNTSYLWNRENHLVTSLFLDFVPRTYVQQGTLFWRQNYSPVFFSKFSLLGVDVIEYARIQNVRERLPSSPYRQASLALAMRSSPRTVWDLTYLMGFRDVDGLTKKEYRLDVSDQMTFGRRWETSASAGYRDNFTSNDIFLRLGLGYFSRKWEWNLLLEGGKETSKRSEPVKHPVIVELAATNLISSTLYWTLSLQSASDETVQIWTAFFKLGYRFGNREVAPLRDGAPPRGSL